MSGIAERIVKEKYAYKDEKTWEDVVNRIVRTVEDFELQTYGDTEGKKDNIKQFGES